MEDFWDKTKKKEWDKIWKSQEFETYEFVEQKWQDYLKNYLDCSEFGFKGYLIDQHVSTYINPYRVGLDLKTWMDVKYKIFQ